MRFSGGQTINFNKPVVVFSSNTPKEDRRRLASSMQYLDSGRVKRKKRGKKGSLNCSEESLQEHTVAWALRICEWLQSNIVGEAVVKDHD
ncbi:conserved hypothetical protein [Ricinus communis]|uniref:Uncharacterized protein n=1 Tax=Ricinus communis TaxID=3988 RepID=B9T819_RICCO|nr:conserved hypothetical protein [Ricinus communis]